MSARRNLLHFFFVTICISTVTYLNTTSRLFCVFCFYSDNTAVISCVGFFAPRVPVCRVNSLKWNSEPRILPATVGGQFSLKGLHVGSSGLLDSTFHSLAGLGIQRTVCEQSEVWCQWCMSSHHWDVLRVPLGSGTAEMEAGAPGHKVSRSCPPFAQSHSVFLLTAQVACSSSRYTGSFLGLHPAQVSLARASSFTPSDPGMTGPVPF